MNTIKLDQANPWAAPEPGQPAVRVESMLFSVVEPAEGKAVEYNDWYERDHQFDGGMSGAGWFSNRRWVATRRLKTLRFPEDGAFDDLGIGSLAQIYWRQQGCARSSETWAREQWAWLNDEHRIYSDRQHFHSASYWLLSTLVAEGERVPIELALQHPFAGLAVLMIDDGCADGAADRDAAIGDLERIAAEELVALDAPIVASWELLREPGQPASRPAATLIRGSHDMVVQLIFLRADPEALWPRITDYAARIEAETSSKIVFASGFIPTVPGTTTHLEEI